MRRKNYEFKYNEYTIEHIMKSPYILCKDRKEKEILKLTLEGKTCPQIASRVGYSERTILNRRREIYEKTKKYLEKTDELEIKEILFKVYLLTFPNGKVYVGITSKEENNRWKDGKGYVENEDMYNDILKYGWNNVKKNILFRNLTEEQAREKEKELIIHYKSHLKKYGYNRSF